MENKWEVKIEKYTAITNKILQNKEIIISCVENSLLNVKRLNHKTIWISNVCENPMILKFERKALINVLIGIVINKKKILFFFSNFKYDDMKYEIRKFSNRSLTISNNIILILLYSIFF